MNISMSHTEAGPLPINLYNKVPNEAVSQLGRKKPTGGKETGEEGLCVTQQSEELWALILPTQRTQSGHPLCPELRCDQRPKGGGDPSCL